MDFTPGFLDALGIIFGGFAMVVITPALADGLSVVRDAIDRMIR
jgi:hypothetical protein